MAERAERLREELSAIKRWMTREEHTALIGGVSMLLDEALDDLTRLSAAQQASVAAIITLLEEALLLDYLPRQYRARYNVRFVRRFLACLMTVAYKFAQRPWRPLSCVAEKMAANAFISAGRVVLDLEGATDVEHAYDRLEGAIFEDMDFAFLCDAQYEGIEETALAEEAGIVNLAFNEWFEPFRPEVVVHPFALE
jgi:hypothetical protein